LRKDVELGSVGYLDAGMTRVQTHFADGLFQLVLDRADAKNAIDAATARQLADAAHKIRELEPRCVLIRAKGDTFCVGGDVREFGGPEGGDAVAATVDAFHEALEVLAGLRVPIVSAVQGWCAGAGIGLACVADVVVVAQGAQFRSAYTGIGFTPDGGLSWVLPRLVGSIRARDFVLTNRVVGAALAVDWGLASRLVPDDELEERASEIASNLARGARSALGTARALLRRPETTTYFEALNEEAAAIKNAAASDEGREGLAAFLQRRPPSFD
jgi:2-(1,2-epoxy-1,2-dihydrophenyl)acetyl-CoA isomerase